MWRIEILHPAVVHFPIALLLTATLLHFTAWSATKTASWVMLVLGAVSAWVAYLTGTWAHEVVNPNLCDPSRTHLHEEWALWASIGYSAAAIITIANKWKSADPWKGLKYNRAILPLLLLVSAGAMAVAGHLGAELVYLQGAAVQMPDAECSNFVE